MGRSVLLLHELPDGSRHYDWLTERDAPGATGLLSFRLLQSIDSPDTGAFEAVRMADHRLEYLVYEGAVSGGRGTVRRVADGALALESEELGMIRLRGHLGAAAGVFEGRLVEGDLWEFRFVAGSGVRGMLG